MGQRRKNGNGTLYQRSDGQWEGRYIIGYSEDGSVKKKYVTAKTKKECAAKLSKIKEEMGLRSDKLDPEMAFSSWIEIWYELYCKPKLRVTTQKNYENFIYNHIIPNIGNISLNQITQAKVQQFYSKMKKNGRITHRDVYGNGLSDRSVRTIHAICRSSLERACVENLISVNPTIGCKLPPKKSGEMKVLSASEVRRFLIQAQVEGMLPLYLLELSSGLRRGEIIALQWKDLNFETGELRIDKQVYRVDGELMVMKPKTKASIRTIILPEIVLRVLRDYQLTVASKWMFPSLYDDNKPRDPHSLGTKLHGILERAGCKQVRYHDLRHTFATLALEQGMDVKSLSAVLGHVSSDITLDIYAHITTDMQIEAARSIDRSIGKASELDSRSTVKVDDKPKDDFKPVLNTTRRHPGMGCISEINDHLYEGRWSPKWIDGKRISRNVYATTREECELKLAQLIRASKEELAMLKKAKGKKGRHIKKQ